jgi:Overcoming lysogenization defect protein-like, TOPRIM domain
LDFTRVKQKISRMGNQEVVFANYAILTEGQDDQGVVQELLTRAGIDSDALSISVVNCDGVNQIRDYIRLCAELGIDFYVIHDRGDDNHPVIKKRNKAILDAVTTSTPANPSLHVYNPTLESAMGVQKQKENLDSLPEVRAGRLSSFPLIPSLVPLWFIERKNFEAVQLRQIAVCAEIKVCCRSRKILDDRSCRGKADSEATTLFLGSELRPVRVILRRCNF